MKRLLYLLIVGVLVSCGYGNKQKVLMKADSLLEEYPDSAYQVLKDSINEISRLGQRNKMEYLLTYAEAMNKAYIPMDTIKFMDDVLDYYNFHGSNNEKIVANYMQGCVFRDKGNSPEALRYFNIAVSNADTLSHNCDYVLLSRIYGQMAFVYMEQRYPYKELEAWKKGRKYAYMGKDTLSAIQYLEKSSNVYLLKGDYKSYMSVVDSAINEYSRHGYPQYAAACQIHKVHLYLQKGNIEEARKSLRIFKKKSGLFNSEGIILPGHELYYYYEGTVLEKSGNVEAALRCFYKLLLYKADIQNVENAYKGLMESYALIGKSDSLIKYSKLYAQTNDSANILKSAKEIIRMQSLFNYSESQQNLMEKTKESRNLWLALLLFFVIVLFLSSFIFDRFKKRKKEVEKWKNGYRQTLTQLRKAETELEEIQNDSDSFKKQKQEEVESLQRRLSTYNENFRIQDWANEQCILHHAIVEHLRKLSGKGIVMSSSEWGDLESTIKKLMGEFYSKMETYKPQLTDQEFKVCVLIRLKFSSTDISNLLGISQQRVTNIKSNINAKLFHQRGSRSLNANISSL